MDKIGQSALMQNLNGTLSVGTVRKRVFGVCIMSSLNGTLTIYGVSNLDGSPTTWVIAQGSSGYIAPPGSAFADSMISYSFSNISDAGSAFIAWAE